MNCETVGAKRATGERSELTKSPVTEIRRWQN